MFPKRAPAGAASAADDSENTIRASGRTTTPTQAQTGRLKTSSDMDMPIEQAESVDINSGSGAIGQAHSSFSSGAAAAAAQSISPPISENQHKSDNGHAAAAASGGDSLPTLPLHLRPTPEIPRDAIDLSKDGGEQHEVEHMHGQTALSDLPVNTGRSADAHDYVIYTAGGDVAAGVPAENLQVQGGLPVPSVKMQRRRSSLAPTACEEIGEAATGHLEEFLAMTQLERNDSGDRHTRRHSDGGFHDSFNNSGGIINFNTNLNDSGENAHSSADSASDHDYQPGSHYLQNQSMGGALTAAAELVAPERARTASPTLPGQTEGSYLHYMHAPAAAQPSSSTGGSGGRPGVQRHESIGSTGSGRSLRSSGHESSGHASSQSQQTRSSARCYLPVRTFHMDEIVVGRLLGTGTFNDVYEAFLVPNRRTAYGRQASLPTVMAAGHQRRAELGAEAQTTRQPHPQQRPPEGHQERRLSSHSNATITYGSNPQSSLIPSAEIETKYVLKHLKGVVMDDYDTFLTGAVDLALEAKMLSHLHHPNIIRLEGVTAGSLSDALSTGIVGGYFLVLEKIEITLMDQIALWAEQKKATKKTRRRARSGGSGGRLPRRLSSASLGSLSDSSRKLSSASLDGLDRMWEADDGDGGGNGADNSTTRTEDGRHSAPPAVATRPAKEAMFLYHHRLTVAAEIAAGFAYLHRKNILYRDTKPQNIGLDYNGHVKIFDMGLAKELQDGDTRKHTGNCGTKRYMSPECGRFEHYGLSSDVYSFSLLLWEILSLERPFAKLTAKDFTDKVYYGNKRPNIPSKWPVAVRDLLPDCWSINKNDRPTMETISNVLRNMALEAEPLAAATNISISSRSLHDSMHEVISATSEILPNQADAVTRGKSRQRLFRKSSKHRASFRFGGSNKSLGGSKKSAASNEGTVVPHNIRKWLEQQEQKERQQQQGSATLRAALAGGAEAAVQAAMKSSIAKKSLPRDDSFDEADGAGISKEPLDPPGGDAERELIAQNEASSSLLSIASDVRGDTGGESNEASPSTIESDPLGEAQNRRGSDQSSMSVGSMLFPARPISRRASTRDI